MELHDRDPLRSFVRHPVDDYATWRKAYDDFDQERRSLGVVGAAVYQSVDDANDLTIWHDFATREQAEAFASSARLKEVMQAAGVAAPPTIWFATEA